MEKDTKSPIDKLLKLFHYLEYGISIILAIIIAGILAVAVIRIAVYSYLLIFSQLLTPTNIDYGAFNDIFKKIMTLLITIEFMNSILHILKTGELKQLLKDVTLITGLAIARKLIIFEYTKAEPMTVIAMGIELVSVGIFYFLIRVDTLSKYVPRGNREVKKKRVDSDPLNK